MSFIYLYASLCVIAGPYSCLWVLLVLMRPYRSLLVFMGPYTSLCVLIGPDATLRILESFYVS